VRGKLFSTSFESIKQVPCLLSKLADPHSKFKNHDASGALFIDRNPKHFATILDIITNYGDSDYWPLPDDIKEFKELMQEVDFYSLPSDIIDLLKDKLAELADEENSQLEKLQSQIKELLKDKESLMGQLSQELHDKIELREMLSDCQIKTHGCYVSISELPLSLRINKDLTKVQWSLHRSLERVRKGSSIVYSPQKIDREHHHERHNNHNGHSNNSHHHQNSTSSITYELRPINPSDAGVVLWSDSKSYIMCERKIDDNLYSRVDLCCIGNGELLVIFDSYPSPPRHSIAGPAENEQFGDKKERIICRFQADVR